MTLLISMMRLATSFRIPWLLGVPKYNKPKTTLFSTDCCYLRTDDEISRFLRAALTEGEHVWMLYATAIYTGLRAGELAALEWSDIDFAQRRIAVQHSFHTLTKSSRSALRSAARRPSRPTSTMAIAAPWAVGVHQP